jgi:CRISPR-associated exonuclease Cas4
MTVNATLINLYNVCPRECWLHANGIRMEHTSDMVADGKLLHEISYADRNMKHSELSIEAQYNGISLYGKIDFYDAKREVIHETKRGNKVENAHIWQLKFYIWLFKLNGIDDVIGIIEYPLLRQTEEIILSVEDIEQLQVLTKKVVDLKENEVCPPVINAKICKSCSYYELCYVDE